MERLAARRPSPDPDTAEALAVARGMAGVLTGQLTAEAAGALEDALRAAEPAAANWDTRAALLWTMITAERFQQVEEALPAMIEAATRGGSARGLIAVYSSLGFLKLRLGALPEADGAARVALRVLRRAISRPVWAWPRSRPRWPSKPVSWTRPRPCSSSSSPGPRACSASWPRRPAGRLSLARGDGQQALSCFQAVPGDVRRRRVGNRDP